MLFKKAIKETKVLLTKSNKYTDYMLLSMKGQIGVKGQKGQKGQRGPIGPISPKGKVH